MSNAPSITGQSPSAAHQPHPWEAKPGDKTLGWAPHARSAANIRVGREVSGQVVDLPIGGKLHLELSETTQHTWKVEPGDRTLGKPSYHIIPGSRRGDGYKVRFTWLAPSSSPSQARPGGTHPVKLTLGPVGRGAPVDTLNFTVRLNGGQQHTTTGDWMSGTSKAVPGYGRPASVVVPAERSPSETTGTTLRQTPAGAEAMLSARASQFRSMPTEFGWEWHIDEQIFWDETTTDDVIGAGCVDSDGLVRMHKQKQPQYPSYVWARAQKFWTLSGPRFDGRPQLQSAIRNLIALSGDRRVCSAEGVNPLDPSLGGLSATDLDRVLPPSGRENSSGEFREVAMVAVKLLDETSYRTLFVSSGEHNVISNEAGVLLGEFVRDAISANGGADNVEEVLFVHTHPSARDGSSNFGDQKFRAVATSQDLNSHLVTTKRYLSKVPPERIGDYTASLAENGRIYLAEYGRRVDPQRLAMMRESWSGVSD